MKIRKHFVFILVLIGLGMAGLSGYYLSGPISGDQTNMAGEVDRKVEITGDTVRWPCPHQRNQEAVSTKEAVENAEDKDELIRNQKTGACRDAVDNEAGVDKEGIAGNAEIVNEVATVGETAASCDRSHSEEIVARLLIDIAIVGKAENLLFIDGDLLIAESNKWGYTPLGALDSTGVEYEVSSVFGGFVTGIKEYHNEGMSGWMYKVNGEVPMVGADKFELNKNDNVIWWYSESIAHPGPTWDQVNSLNHLNHLN